MLDILCLRHIPLHLSRRRPFAETLAEGAYVSMLRGSFGDKESDYRCVRHNIIYSVGLVIASFPLARTRPASLRISFQLDTIDFVSATQLLGFSDSS